MPALTDQQSAAIEAGRTALRARFAGGAFPAALGQAIADDLADVAMGPVLAEVERLRAESEQRLGELLYWEFEYRAAMDNYRGERWQVKQLRADALTARAAGYRSASNDVAEMRTLHGSDFDTDMVLVFLDRGAELRETQAAAEAAQAPACTCRAETVHQAGCDTGQHT